MEHSIPELIRIEEKLNEILKRLKLREIDKIPEWVDLRLASKFKTIPYNTIVNRPGLQPDKSKLQIIGGRRKWPKKVILEWLMLSDFDLQNMPEEKVRKSKKTKQDKVEVHGTVLLPIHTTESKGFYKWLEDPVWIDTIEELRREFSEKKSVQRGVQNRDE
jgi:hypothetical protein